MAKIIFAPLQGFTELPYRLAHSKVCGGIDEYCAPFIRLEHGQIRKKDLRDISFQEDICQIPQVIAANKDEFITLTQSVLSLGYERVDLNMGCPFPMQTKRGRGATLVSEPDSLKEILSAMDSISKEHDGKVSFSVKMRLGVDDPSQWKGVISLLNDSVVRSITAHPRIASQQYSGNLYLDQWDELYSACEKPLIFNGDVSSVADIESTLQKYPSLEGVMIGRGLLSRPTLANEYKSGKTLSDDELRAKVLSMHQMILSYYSQTLEGGDGQILQKMVPFWEYMEPLFSHKALKTIRKTGSLKNYQNLVLGLK